VSFAPSAEKRGLVSRITGGLQGEMAGGGFRERLQKGFIWSHNLTENSTAAVASDRIRRRLQEVRLITFVYSSCY
jgi:hypothetical protein